MRTYVCHFSGLLHDTKTRQNITEDESQQEKAHETVPTSMHLKLSILLLLSLVMIYDLDTERCKYHTTN